MMIVQRRRDPWELEMHHDLKAEVDGLVAAISQGARVDAAAIAVH
jgi:hypothetical protein